MSDLSRLIVPASSGGTSVVTNSQTLSANNATASTAIFGLTGTVEIIRLWAVVTTVLGSNITATYWRLNDQTAQVDITASSGTAASSFAAGSVLYKKGLAATALTAVNNSAGRLNESTANLADFSTAVITKKTAATTNVEFVYTTTNTPTSGVLKHYVEYRPISDDGVLVAV